ncbi:MarR family transcriptional regulator [Pueribacillus theae]|uniref:MarR family transcriptional regulator n=1 Tax=Pueribacillus theae TaxID=2171751 RepID=A0A2U1JTI5_9BACI|nr:MarR family transcriptional regulator [Pueribacillus theae]PWA08422.1 MarR family transcriptional regulator [Pueribacillus theae]
MSNDLIENIELEMAFLSRRIALVGNKIEWNLDRSAYLLLHYLHVKGPLGVKGLANELQLDISTVSRQASALGKKGYVDKIPDPSDRRAYFYQITELGMKQLSDYKQARFNKFTKLLDGWSDEERIVFGQLLKKFNQAIREKL